MSSRPLAAVVLAAGKGKRMRAAVPKVLLEACGRSLLDHVLEALRPLGAAPVAVVYGHGGDAVPRSLAGRDLVLVHQAEQLGTGHAVQCALAHLDGLSGDLLVVCGDTPLLDHRVLAGLVEDHRSAGRALTVLSAEPEDPGSLGRVLRDPDGSLRAIREASDASAEERAVREINTGVMVLATEHLAGALARLERGNAQGEFYLTDVPGLLLGDGLPVEAHRTQDATAALGVNDPLELARATALLRARFLSALLAGGVLVQDPGTTCVDAGVEVGAGTVLRPHTFLACGVRVGRGCTVGPYASLGPGTVVEDGAVLGAHVELRASTVGAGTRIPGPARLSNAVLGRGVHVGPGTVTEEAGEARVVIGECARVGAGSVLRPPVTVAAGARVGAHSILGREPGGPAGGDDDA